MPKPEITFQPDFVLKAITKKNLKNNFKDRKWTHHKCPPGCCMNPRLYLVM